MFFSLSSMVVRVSASTSAHATTYGRDHSSASLAELKEAGLITDEEYAAKRAELVERI